jgi:curved DNA-binding protein CbpA
MDSRTAFEILEIDFVYYGKIDYEYLKKKYHKSALRNHPDKNGNTAESNEKFQQIKEAFEYLKIEMETDNPEKDKDNETSPVYADFVHLFVSGIMNNNYFTKIVKEIVTSYKTTISKSVFDGLDRDTSFKIYTFLSKYHTTFNLSQDMLNEIRNIVTNKFNNSMVYTLNPSINDLFENNVYKLYVNEQLYIVPLWHHEMYFDCDEGEIIVICEPQLPDNVTIDEDNNLHTDATIQLSDFNFRNIQVHVGNKSFEIPSQHLYLKKEQIYRIKNKGITKIKDDIYNITEKADIIVKISIC